MIERHGERIRFVAVGVFKRTSQQRGEQGKRRRYRQGQGQGVSLSWNVERPGEGESVEVKRYCVRVDDRIASSGAERARF